MPREGKENKSLDGGRKGGELLHNFLDRAFFHLKKGGECYFVTSSLNNWSEKNQNQRVNGLKFERTGMKRIFFEKLTVFKAVK